MKRLSVLSAFALCLTTSASYGQGAPLRAGWQGALGLGGGSMTLSCTGCTDGGVNSLTEMARVGYAVRGDLLTSIEYTGWQSGGNNGLTETLTYINVVAQWYPQIANGLFIKAGAGVSIFGGGTSGSAGDAKNSATGFGFTVGAGYDFHLRSRIYITPFVDYLYGANPHRESQRQRGRNVRREQHDQHRWCDRLALAPYSVARL